MGRKGAVARTVAAAAATAAEEASTQAATAAEADVLFYEVSDMHRIELGGRRWQTKREKER